MSQMRSIGTEAWMMQQLEYCSIDGSDILQIRYGSVEWRRHVLSFICGKMRDCSANMIFVPIDPIWYKRFLFLLLCINAKCHRRRYLIFFRPPSISSCIYFHGSRFTFMACCVFIRKQAIIIITSLLIFYAYLMFHCNLIAH